MIRDKPFLSIIMPALNEAALLPGALSALAAMRSSGAEIIVVDGGSQDGTAGLARASGLVDVIVISPPGRATQMNAGASRARGETLLFLHVDTRLPSGADTAIASGLAGSTGWGRFDVAIDGKHWLLPFIARCMSLRSRISGMATGDQAIFVSRNLFEGCGGFPDQPLMEDVALSRALKRLCAPICLRERVTTSGRRWERNGVLKTVILMWLLRLAYYFGVSPQGLALIYESPRRESRS
jgi:rSAM/selenodomain-associated transferase 2